MRDVIQPFPTFSEAFLHALLELRVSGCGCRVTLAPSTRLDTGVSQASTVHASPSSGDAPRLARVVDVDAHEGPVYAADEHALYFTSVPRPGRRAPSSTSSATRSRLAGGQRAGGGRPHGERHGPGHDGALLVCEQGSLTLPARDQRASTARPASAETSSSWPAPLNSPNDIVVKSDGTIWFTDPELRVPAGLPARSRGRRRRLPLRPAHRGLRSSPTASTSRTASLLARRARRSTWATAAPTRSPAASTPAPAPRRAPSTCVGGRRARRRARVRRVATRATRTA